MADNNEIKDLCNTNLYISIVEINTPVWKRINSKDCTDKSTTLAEEYALHTFNQLTEVSKCLEQLRQGIDMLSGYRSSHMNINRYEYIVCQIENYYLRVTSIYDRCLLLTNTVFQLGLKKQQCKTSTITENNNIRKTRVASCLKKLDEFTKKFREHRNNISHSHTFNDQEGLGIFEIYSFIKEQGDKDLIKFDHIFKYKVDNYIKEKKIEFTTELEKGYKITLDLFNELEMPYTVRFNRLLVE